MKILLEELKKECILLNMIYNKIIYKDEESILIQKTSSNGLSVVEIRELIEIYDIVNKRKNFTLKVLDSGDIYIKMDKSKKNI